MARDSFQYTAQDMTRPEESSCLGGKVIVFSARCPEKTTDNEDSAAVVSRGDQCGVLVVADGLGGAAAGEEASRIAVEAIQSAVERSDDETALRTAILNGIESANQQVLGLGVGAATTLAAVEIQGDRIRPYHVGDSAVLVVGQRGKVKLLTVAHSPVGLAVEAGVLDNEEAMHHEDRHVVSNFLGARDMRIEIGPTLRLSRFDTVLLATDGLFDNLSVADVVEGVRKGPLLDGLLGITTEAARRMKGFDPHRPGKPDDLTVIGFRRNGSTPELSRP